MARTTAVPNELAYANDYDFVTEDEKPNHW